MSMYEYQDGTYYKVFFSGTELSKRTKLISEKNSVSLFCPARYLILITFFLNDI